MKNAFKIVTAETRYLPVIFKVKKTHKFKTTGKHLLLFLLFLSRYTKQAYDILSKIIFEDSNNN